MNKNSEHTLWAGQGGAARGGAALDRAGCKWGGPSWLERGGENCDTVFSKRDHILTDIALPGRYDGGAGGEPEAAQLASVVFQPCRCPSLGLASSSAVRTEEQDGQGARSLQDNTLKQEGSLRETLR